MPAPPRPGAGHGLLQGVVLMRFSSWLAPFARHDKPRPPRHSRAGSPPSLELLEDRVVPSTFFTQTNLVTDNQAQLAAEGLSPAAHTDANLVNPWGVAFAPTGPFWVADNGTGVSTLYNGTGTPQALVVTIPASSNSGATSPAPVTGTVFNGSSTDFLVAGAGTAAHFLFVTEDGTLAAWNSGNTAVLKVDNADFTNGPVYKGLAIGNLPIGNLP